MSKFKFLQSIKSFNNTVKLSILILFTLITFYTSIIFFNLDPLKLIIASLLFLVVLIFAILIFDTSYFKYKGFDLKDLVLAIITVAFFLLFFVLPPKLKVYFPTFPLLMLDTDAFLHYDTAFHVSIINSILNFGYPSIGQHNSPFLFYHVLSHYIDALIIFFSGLDALESYGLFYYFKFISIFSGVLFLISQILKVNQIYKYLLSLIIFTQLIFGDFHIIASHSLWFTSVIMLFSFSNVINIIKNDENKKKDYLFLILLITIVTLGKINYGIIFAIFIVSFLFFKNLKKNFVECLSLLVLIFFLMFTFFLILYYNNNLYNISNFLQFNTKLDVNFLILVFFKVFFLSFLNYIYKSNFIKFSLASTLFCACIVTFIKIFFTKSFSLYFVLAFDFILTVIFFYIFVHEMEVKNKNIFTVRKEVNNILIFVIFLFNKLTFSLFIFFINFKKKIFNFILVIFYFSIANIYNDKNFNMISFEPSIDILNKISYYNNSPYSQIIEKNYIFHNRSFNIFSINELNNLYYNYFPINYFLYGNDKLSFLRILKYGKQHSNLIKKKVDGNFYQFRKNLNFFVIDNNYKKKDLLLFVPKEKLESIFSNSELMKLRDNRWSFGLYLYSVTGIPLVYGVNKLYYYYGYGNYDVSSLSLYSYEINISDICKFNKDIIKVESFLDSKFSIIKCLS